jgi:hypothetical protein
VNDELRAQQSSITTLDRDQLPDGYVNNTRLVLGALHHSYTASSYPAADGQQNTVITSYPGGWVNVDTGTGIQLTDWKGGHLHFEWAGNAFINGCFARGANIGFPKNPKYLNLRITANGVTIAEKRGPGYHEAFRVIASTLVAQGPLTIRLQWRITEPSEDEPVFTSAGDVVPQAHLWGMRYLAIGRWR